MKKFFVILAVFSLFFIVSCGGSKKSGGNESSDSDEPENDADIVDTDTPDTPDIEVSDEDFSDTAHDDTDPEDDADADIVEEGCRIEDSFKNSVFEDGEYYLIKGTAYINDGDLPSEQYTQMTKTFLKIALSDPDDYLSYESDKTHNDGYTYLNYAFNQYDAAYIASQKINDETVLTAVVNSLADYLFNAVDYTDADGRLTLPFYTSPVIVYKTEIYNSGKPEATFKRCPVAVSKFKSGTSDEFYGFKGRMQLCPGEDKSFAVGETLKIGLDAELSSSDEDILVLFNYGYPVEDVLPYDSVAELCDTGCAYEGTEKVSNGKCGCREGTVWNEEEQKCIGGPCDPNPCKSVANSNGTCSVSNDGGTFSCGCKNGFIWDKTTEKCVADGCFIDDSYEHSSFDEYYLVRGDSTIYASENEYSIIVMNGKAYFYFNDTRTDLYSIFIDKSIAGNDFVDVEAPEGGFNLISMSSSSTAPYTIVKVFLSNSLLAISGNYTDSDGRIAFPVAPVVKVFQVDKNPSENGGIIRECLIAVSKMDQNDISHAKGSMQICLGQNGTFDVGEKIKLGIDADLTSDADEMLEVLNYEKTPEEYLTSDDLCSSYCSYKNSTYDPATDSCVCAEGYLFSASTGECEHSSD